MNKFIALICGLVFSAGLTISQMVDPNKVLNFLDVFGAWDASLAFVMGGGLLVYIVGFYLIVKPLKKPVAASKFELPNAVKVDKKLIVGSCLFGLGWGISGICPGPGIANLIMGNDKILGFLLMMSIGMFIARKVK